MALEAQIARRYLFGKERPFMAGLLTWVGILGIAIGVFALIVIQSVMTGFSQDLQKKILRFSPSLVLKPLNPSLFSGKKAPQLDATQKLKVTPYVDSEVILHTEEPLTQGVKLRGIELDSFFMKSLNPEWGMGVGPQEWASAEGELPGVLVGAELAKRLNLIPTILEEVELIYPFGEVDPTGEMRPKTRKFRVMGTFKTGYFDYDNKYAVIDLKEARRLIPAQEVPTEWGVWFDDLFKAPMIASSLQSLNTNEFKVESWSERNRRLFYSLKFERVTMFLILSIMILIASFNILSLILMMSVDKTKEIAIFRSIGLSQNGVQKIFLRMGFYLGLIGTSLGLFLGVAAVAYLKWKPLKLPSLYYLEGLPIQWDVSILITVVLIAPLISLLSSWYPARRAAQQEIVTALRYD